MTSLNETSRNSRINIYIASVLCLLVLAAVVLLFMVVRSLDAEFGDVRRNLPSIEREITTLGERRDQLADTVTGLEERQLTLRGSVADLEPLSARVQSLRAEALDLESAKSAAEIRLRELGEVEARIKTANESQTNLQRNIALLETQQNGLADKVSNLDGDRNKLSDEVGELRGQRDKLQAEERRLRGEVAGLGQQRAEVDTLTQKTSDLDAKVAELAPRAQGATKQLADLQGQIAVEQGVLDGLKSEVSAGRSTEAVLRAANIDLETRKQALNASIATAQTQLDVSKAELTSSAAAVSESQVLLTALSAKSADAASKIAAAEQDRLALQAEVLAAQNTLAELSAEIAARSIVRSALADAEQRLSGVEASLAARSTESQALSENLAQKQADVASVKRDLQSANEELLSNRGELTLAQNRLAELNAEIAARGIVFSALAQAEQNLLNLEASAAAKKVESKTQSEILANLRVELGAVVADLGSSRNQLADIFAQRTNAEIKRDEAIRTARAAEERGLDLSQTIESRTEALVRVQAEIRKARMDLARENKAVEDARAALAALTSERVGSLAQTDGPGATGNGVAPEQGQKDAGIVDPPLGTAVAPNPTAPANDNGVQPQLSNGVKGESN